MRKLSKKQRRHYLSTERRRKAQELRYAGFLRDRALRARGKRRRYAEYYELRQARRSLRKGVYRKRRYDGESRIVKIDGDFGTEDADGIDYFLRTSSEFIDFEARELLFDISQCTRIWPSGITLLCSLMQWVELTSTAQHRPRLASTSSSSNKLNSYLAHCGFYEYVHRQHDTDESYYSDNDIVKIQRETKPRCIEDREAAIIALVEKHGALSRQEIEKFDAKVLTEVFNNITEHGVSYRDRGWWVLAQFHPTHKMISVCFADNCVGIRNSLMTGPQKESIGSSIQDVPENDGEFIKLAIEQIVSGALAAPVPQGRFVKRYESGARRGNGLKRIRAACSELHIPFSILSHHGYVFVDADGRMVRMGAEPKRIFAGTMYQFTIKSV
jgi:hypothetical protein